MFSLSVWVDSKWEMYNYERVFDIKANFQKNISCVCVHFVSHFIRHTKARALSRTFYLLLCWMSPTTPSRSSALETPARKRKWTGTARLMNQFFCRANAKRQSTRLPNVLNATEDKNKILLWLYSRFCFVSLFFVPWIRPKVVQFQIFSAKQRTGDESH